MIVQHPVELKPKNVQIDKITDRESSDLNFMFTLA